MVAVRHPDDLVAMSVALAVLLLGMYAAGLVFLTRTHRSVFAHLDERHSGQVETTWSLLWAAGVPAISSVLVVLMGDLLVDSIHDAAVTVGSSEFFLAFVVVGAVGAITTNTFADAAQDKMDVVVHITIGSGVQSAMVVIPLLVIASLTIGSTPMALVFNAYEVSAVLIAVLIASLLAQQGETTWFAGVQLVSAWVVLGIVAYYA
jgi:Ca2+:H+ antiporter